MCRVSMLVLLSILSPIIVSSAIAVEAPFGVVKTETDHATGIIFNLKKNYVKKRVKEDKRWKYGYIEVDPCIYHTFSVHSNIQILVKVPKEINLADETIAKSILEKAKNYLFRKCARKVIGIGCGNRMESFSKKDTCRDWLDAGNRIYLFNSEFNEENWKRNWVISASVYRNPNKENLMSYKNKAYEDAKAK